MLILKDSQTILKGSMTRLLDFHVELTGESLSAIGRAVFNDGSYLTETIRKGRQVTPKSYDKVYTYIVGRLKERDDFTDVIAPKLLAISPDDLDKVPTDVQG